MSNNEPKYSFEEFKLMYESTEKVTDRRLEANRWNYTVCIAVLLAIAGIIDYSINNISFFYIGLISIIVLSGMAISFCFHWIRQKSDFKSLNKAKFEVLNEMAPNVEYNPENPGIINPFCSFAKEWQKLDDMEALQKAGKKKVVALKSSTIEYFIPYAFIFLFIGVILVVSALILPNRSAYIQAKGPDPNIGIVQTQQKKK
jgi:hypothetical protein